MTDFQDIELLAPAGTWDSLKSAVAAGADAVYLGGKRFNMRMHRTDVNFDDAGLKKAVEFAHDHQVRLYITVNNLLSDREIPAMKEYLRILEDIRPDALIVQDLAMLQLIRQLNISIPLHASVMLNTHSVEGVQLLQKHGIERIVTSRELSLAELSYIRAKTGVELEYFIHGDMCISQSGQCYHSGLLFGQSSNRGRCLKPCRWPYTLVDHETGNPVATDFSGPYLLAMKDMCLFRHLPELIQSGVCSFKIEGRMRTADFIHRIVRTYRQAIDRYLADPTGYTWDEKEWEDLWNHRARDFSTCYAFGNPGTPSVSHQGNREPRFFSQAVKESSYALLPPAALPAAPPATGPVPQLTVKVSSLAGFQAACEGGADCIHIGGDVFLPEKAWTLENIREAAQEGKKRNIQVVLATPRITMEKELRELAMMLPKISDLPLTAVSVGNLGALHLLRRHSDLPIYGDYGLNIFNHVAVLWLESQGVRQITPSLEAPCDSVCQLAQESSLPLEMIIHGIQEGMIMSHCLLDCKDQHSDCYKGLTTPPPCRQGRYDLLDSAGERHLLAVDQYCRSHLLLGRDLCLLPYLPTLLAAGIRRFRIEGQLYSPQWLEQLTRTYKEVLGQMMSGSPFSADTSMAFLEKNSPRPFGPGVFRYRASR